MRQPLPSAANATRPDRERAQLLLRRIEKESLYASLLLHGESGFVRTLVLGVLRWRSRLDWIIATLAKRSINQLDAQVVESLRLGLYQLLYMDVAPYAAVSETVELTPKRARGFVNAILRSAQRGTPQPTDLATRTAHPEWLIARWTNVFGSDRATAIAEANQELSYPDVLALGDPPPESEPSALVDSVWKLKGSSAELDRADFYPMDEGSAVIAAIAHACGDSVLDVAAAPGGKSIYMTSRGARVVSNDVSLSRLRPLIGRGGQLLVSDGRKPPFRKPFDVVLLDAPCSATGTIRKNPELKWRLKESDLTAAVALQRELIAGAGPVAGNYLVYSTCSLEREENDEVVATVEGFEVVDATPFVPAGARAWVQDGVLRLTPESGADGFTAFVLKRK